MIPQANVISTRQQAKESRNQGAANFANTAISGVQTTAAIRESMIKNAYALAEDYVTNQLGGNWAEFYVGTPVYDDAGNFIRTDPNPLAQNLLRTMYGRQRGDTMLEELKARATETAPQTEQRAINAAVQSPRQAPTQPAPQQTAPNPNMSYPVPTKTSQPVSFVPPSRRSVVPAQAGFTPLATAGSVPSAQRYQRAGASSGAPGSQLIPQQIVDIAKSISPDRAAGMESYLAYRAGQQPTQAAQEPTPSYLRNKAGLPVAQGQENTIFPINDQTTSMFARIRPFDAGNNDDIKAAFAELGTQLGGPDAAALLSMSGEQFFKNPEYAKKYDAEARRVFGVDGATLAGMRLDMIENMRDGLTGEELLTPRRSAWWHTGNAIPDTPSAQAVIEATNSPNPSDSSVQAAIDYFSKGSPKDMVRIAAQEPETIDRLIGNGLSIGLSRAAERYSLNGTSTGILSSLAPEFRSMFTAASKGAFDLREKTRNSRETAAFRVITETTKRGIETARRQIESSPVLAGVNAAARSQAGASPYMTGTMLVGRDRLYQIMDEIESGDMTMAIASSLPEGVRTERTFKEAVRQFNEQMTDSRIKTDLSERQVSVAEQMGAINALATLENIDIARAEIALKSIELSIAQQAASASQTGNTAKIADDFITFQQKIVMDAIDNMQLETKGDHDKYMEMYAKEYQNNPQFASALDNIISYYSATLGVQPNTVSVLFKKGLWPFRRVEQVEVPTMNFSFGGTMNPVAPTVTNPTEAPAQATTPAPQTGQAGIDFATGFLKQTQTRR